MPLFVSCALSKISISLLLLRLLGRAANRVQNFVLWGINIFVAAYTLVYLVNNVTICVPIGKLWNREIHGSCWFSRMSNLVIPNFQAGG